MAYRDRRICCPRCGSDLVGYPAREKWRCRDCGGVLAGSDELPVEVITRDWPEARRRQSPLGCPGCGDQMHRIVVAGVEIERCDRESLVWFDSGELGFLDAYFATPL